MAGAVFINRLYSSFPQANPSPPPAHRRQFIMLALVTAGSWIPQFSHMPCRHNVTCKLFIPSIQTRLWVKQAVFLYGSEHFSMTPADHDGVRGMGMTLSCRPDPDPEQIPLQESYCLFLTLATRKQTKTAY